MSDICRDQALYRTISGLWGIVDQRDEAIVALKKEIQGMKVTADSATSMIGNLGRERTELAAKLESEVKSSLQALDVQQERIRVLEQMNKNQRDMLIDRNATIDRLKGQLAEYL